MNPYLRPLETNVPQPEDWTVEPAGPWKGHEVEIVYNPRRHDVMAASSRSAMSSLPPTAKPGSGTATASPPPAQPRTNTRRRCGFKGGSRALKNPPVDLTRCRFGWSRRPYSGWPGWTGPMR